GRVARQGVERVPHLPRVSLEASQSRDLAVGGHAPAGNSLYHGVDTAPVSAGAQSTRRAASGGRSAAGALSLTSPSPLTAHYSPKTDQPLDGFRELRGIVSQALLEDRRDVPDIGRVGDRVTPDDDQVRLLPRDDG